MDNSDFEDELEASFANELDLNDNYNENRDSELSHELERPENPMGHYLLDDGHNNSDLRNSQPANFGDSYQQPLEIANGRKRRYECDLNTPNMISNPSFNSIGSDASSFHHHNSSDRDSRAGSAMMFIESMRDASNVSPSDWNLSCSTIRQQLMGMNIHGGSGGVSSRGAASENLGVFPTAVASTTDAAAAAGNSTKRRSFGDNRDLLLHYNSNNYFTPHRQNEDRNAVQLPQPPSFGPVGGIGQSRNLGICTQNSRDANCDVNYSESTRNEMQI